MTWRNRCFRKKNLIWGNFSPISTFHKTAGPKAFLRLKCCQKYLVLTRPNSNDAYPHSYNRKNNFEHNSNPDNNYCTPNPWEMCGPLQPCHWTLHCTLVPSSGAKDEPHYKHFKASTTGNHKATILQWYDAVFLQCGTWFIRLKHSKMMLCMCFGCWMRC